MSEFCVLENPSAVRPRHFCAPASSAGSSLALAWVRHPLPPPAGPLGKPLRVRSLGGHGVIGPHQVRAAGNRGHAVTVFDDHAELGGHMEAVVPIDEVLARPERRTLAGLPDNPWPVEPSP